MGGDFIGEIDMSAGGDGGDTHNFSNIPMSNDNVIGNEDDEMMIDDDIITFYQEQNDQECDVAELAVPTSRSNENCDCYNNDPSMFQESMASLCLTSDELKSIAKEEESGFLQSPSSSFPKEGDTPEDFLEDLV